MTFNNVLLQEIKLQYPTYLYEVFAIKFKWFVILQCSSFEVIEAERICLLSMMGLALGKV